MVLKSRIFKGDPIFEACLVRDSAHITPGARGDHVSKIQGVIMFLDDTMISKDELKSKYYGPSTATAVRNYKSKRNIINRSYQTKADDIVGKMTIQSLDDEIETRQVETKPTPHLICRIDTSPKPDINHILSSLARRRSTRT